jgi:hypothetical protein
VSQPNQKQMCIIQKLFKKQSIFSGSPACRQARNPLNGCIL